MGSPITASRAGGERRRSASVQAVRSSSVKQSGTALSMAGDAALSKWKCISPAQNQMLPNCLTTDGSWVFYASHSQTLI